MKFKSLIRSLLISMMVSLPVAANASDEVKGLFVVVTTPDPQTQMMAMVLSTQTLKKGKSVQVLLCSAGGDLALKNSQEVILEPQKKSPQMLLKNLIKEGVNVQVCPLYLPNKGASMTDVIDGVTQAEPAAVADVLLQPDVNLFAF
ncbi:MAG: hypothetical protein RL122_1352 [Pseudomonadota bacterium]|uniref:DsrE/DsrF-like family protein n=1 Tax=Thiothrix fructosivorans TaxID=111770 RepID=A0A8B0SMQ6_9GAMM|nr:hypothetical protein [Thiothrix fructosivorans]MBO0612175.1 hypothetical protein [Thiothrix fructosivorans]QTX12331.1 hypothetical protein J1836_008410 [Thiothrix fructosivorans]